MGNRRIEPRNRVQERTRVVLTPEEKFRQNVERLCRIKGVKRSEIADVMARYDVTAASKATVNRWFAGSSDPSIFQALALARMLEVSVEELCGEETPCATANGLTEMEGVLLKIIRRMGPEAALDRLLAVIPAN